MSIPKTTKKHRDLQKLRNIVYKDVEKLLDYFDIKYEYINHNYYSTCPIHAGSDNTRAFSISPEKQQWRCWTRSCHNEHGKDIFGLVAGILVSRYNREIPFREVLDTICKIYKVDEKSIKKEIKPEIKDDEFSSIVKIFDNHRDVHNESHIEMPKCNEVSRYFIQRGFAESTLKHFEVMDCIDTKSKLKDRAIIPIHNRHSELVGYIGRAVRHYIMPKFLFTQGIKKTDYLYNLHRALDKTIKTSCLFIVEGQGDVWRLYEAGIENCVGIFGKEISEAQRDIILGLNITTLVVLTDNDQAGRESKFQIQRQFSRMFSLKFPILSKKDIGDMSILQIQNEILPQVKGLY